MKSITGRVEQILFLFLVIILPGCIGHNPRTLRLSCYADNDLFVTLKDNRVKCIRYDNPYDAIKEAPEGSGVMILADGYPATVNRIDTSLYSEALRKHLRLYVEYPSVIPGMETGEPRSTSLERIVVSTDKIRNLEQMKILAFHDCNFIPVQFADPLLSVSKVAGFDKAVFGIGKNKDVEPILFEHENGSLLISTTKLSQFRTARYAPKNAMQAIWSYIFDWLGPAYSGTVLDWKPDVRPSFTSSQKLPQNAVKHAIQRASDWHTTAGMLLDKQGWEEYKQLWHLNDSNILTTVEAVDNSAPQPASRPGNGEFGVLEGIASKVNLDGSQPTRWWLRSDANGESSLAFALRWKVDGDDRSSIIAENLLDWLYFKSGLFQNDPVKANYGLLFWAPGNAQALYQDNDIKAILGCMGTAALLETEKWDEVLIKNILGNFRTTGINGFRGWRLENPDVMRLGWQNYWNGNTVQLQPHYEAWTWASYLWLYDKTGWEPLLEKTRKAIIKMMVSYPNDWRWTNGIQQERGRMLLPLAWLVRVDDRPEYRVWLRMLADDIERCQDKSGAIREEIGELDHGDMAPPASNAAYGTGEAPLIQQNGDNVSDLLYTCNFTFLGLHEAYAATGEEQYKRMADKLADFLVRIQVKSEKHKELDGGWMRAFDYSQWEYWGSNADSGWGAWSIETGWTQAWIPSVLSMRLLDENLWDLTRYSKVGSKFQDIRRQMIPEKAFAGMN